MKGTDEKRLHISVHIDRETVRVAKIQAIVEGVSFQEWVNQAIVQKLTNKAPRKQV